MASPLTLSLSATVLLSAFSHLTLRLPNNVRLVFTFLFVFLWSSSTADCQPLPSKDSLGDPLPEFAVARLGTNRFISNGSTNYLQFLENGQKLLSAGDGGTIRIFDRDGRVLSNLHQSDSGEHLVAVSSDENFAASAICSSESPVILWDLKKGVKLSEFSPGNTITRSLIFTAKNDLLVGSQDGNIQCYSLENQKIVEVNNLHIGDIVQLVSVPNSNTFLSLGMYDRIKIWDRSRMEEAKEWEVGEEDISCLALSSDGKWLAAAKADSAIYLYRFDSRELVHKFEGHTERVNTLEFSPDNKLLASGGKDWSARIWNVESGKLRHELQKKEIVVNAGNQEEVYELSFSPDGKRLAVGTDERRIRIWDADRGVELIPPVGHESLVIATDWSGDGKYIASASHVDRTVRIWNANDFRQKELLKDHQGAILGLAFSTDSQWIGSTGGFKDNSTLVRSLNGKKSLLTFQIPERHFNSIDFSPDGSSFVVADDARTFHLFDQKSGEIRFQVQTDGGRLYDVCFGPDSKSVWGEFTLGVLCRWNLQSDEIDRRFDIENGSVNALAISRDSDMLAAGLIKNGVKVWSLKEGNPLFHLRNEGETVNAVALSPSGNLLAYSAKGTAVEVVDCGTGKIVRVLRGHDGAVFSLAFAPDGKRLVSASGDNTLLVWDVSNLPE